MQCFLSHRAPATGRYSHGEKQTMSDFSRFYFSPSCPIISVPAAPMVLPDIYSLPLIFHPLILDFGRAKAKWTTNNAKTKSKRGSLIDPPIFSSSSRDENRSEEPAYSHNSGEIQLKCQFSRARVQNLCRPEHTGPTSFSSLATRNPPCRKRQFSL